MKIKYAIFDFDGTLFDSMSIWDRVGEIYLGSLGIKPKPSLREDVRALSLHQAVCYVKKEYKVSLSEEEIMVGINRVVENFYLYEVLPKPGVIDFLDQMKRAGISMCIATASDQAQIKAALKRCNMDSYFEKIFTCTEVGHGKDEPLIFRKAMEFLGGDRSNTMVFEDAIHAIRTAKEDGFRVVGVFDASERRQEEVRELTDAYLVDFEHTDDFWKLSLI